MKIIANLLIYYLSLAVLISLLAKDASVGIIGSLIICIYMYPAYLSQSRGHPQANSITTLNLFLGWTFLGWVGALVWAWSDFDPNRKRKTAIDLLK